MYPIEISMATVHGEKKHACRFASSPLLETTHTHAVFVTHVAMLLKDKDLVTFSKCVHDPGVLESLVSFLAHQRIEVYDGKPYSLSPVCPTKRGKLLRDLQSTINQLDCAFA